MTDVCVNLPPNFRQVCGYLPPPPPPPLEGVKILKFVPIFLLLTYLFMFLTYRGLKKVVFLGVCVGWGGGGGRGVVHVGLL